MKRSKSASLQVCKSANQQISNPPTRRSSNLQPPISILLLLAILLLASFLRFYRLDAQSFWNDEGNSARIAERTVRLIVAGAAGDIHPPGYYLLLHAWRAFCGHSEFALRAFSVFAGILAVAFTCALGRRLFGKTTGLLTAFLAAISPFAVYYSQEARMYALLGALSAASTYLLIRVIADRQIGKSANPQSAIRNLQSLFAYILTSAAGLYTQYAFAFVLLVHNAIFALWWLVRERRWRRLAVWACAQAGVALLYLPWLPVALRAAGWPSAGQAYEPGAALAHVLHVLWVGLTLPEASPTAVMLVFGWIILMQFLFKHRIRAVWFSVVICAIYLLLPIVLIFAFDLYKPEWLKFLVVVLPPFHVLVALGITNLQIGKSANQQVKSPTSNFQRPISNLQSLIPIAAIVFFSIATYPSLHNLYFNPAYARDDYRQIAADVTAEVRPGDAIILNAPNQWEVFTYYYPDRDVYPAPYHPTPEQVETFLAPLTTRYRRLFTLYWGDAESDPQRLVETWLAFHAYKAADRWYGRVRLATYGVAALPEEPVVALDVRFSDAIRLRGYALADERFAPGDVLPVTLFWEAEASPGARYKVTVQLLDAAGQLVAQHDGEPADGLALTDGWQPGQRVLDRHGVALPDNLPPGQYTLAVALYAVAGGARLPVTLDGEPVGDLLTLAGVEVGR